MQKTTNYKGMVLEYCAQYKKKISVPIYNRIGPDHNPEFISQVVFDGQAYVGNGYNKREADQSAYYKIHNILTQPRERSRDVVQSTTQPRAPLRDVKTSRDLLWDQNESVDIYSLDWDTPPGKKYIDKKKPPPVEPVPTVFVRRDSPLLQGLSQDVASKLNIPPKSFPPEETSSDDEADDVIYYNTPLYQYKHYESLKNGFYVVDDSNVVSYFLTLGKFLKNKGFDKNPALLFRTEEQIGIWLYQMFKEGGFNPYGNGQTEQYVLTKPTLQMVNGGWVCTSTCLLPNPINILGEGSDQGEAFDSWVSQLNTYIYQWAPAVNSALRDIFYILRLSPRNEKTWMQFIWDLPEEEAFQKYASKYKEGGFNPYGNGQPLSKAQWMNIHKKQLLGLTKKEISAKYLAYLKTQNKTSNNTSNKGGKMVANMARQSSAVPPSDRKRGVEERAVIKLSGCAKLWGAALRCPFYFMDGSCDYKITSLKEVTDEQLPCIPMFPAIKTRKFYSFVKVSGGVQNVGDVAFILYAPWRLANNYTVNNLNPPLLFSTSSVAYGVESFPIVDTGAAWSDGSASLNTDYTMASLINVANVGVKYRVVAAGLRVKYTGNLMNGAGVIHALEQPDHSTLSGVTLASGSQYETYFNRLVTNQTVAKKDSWITLTHTPVNLEDYEFVQDSISNGISTDAFRQHYMGFLITGLPIGTNLQIEAITHFEVIGQNVRGKTQTDADPVGAAIVTNSTKAETQNQNNTNTTVYQALKEGTPPITITSMLEEGAKVAQTALKLAEVVGPALF